MNTKPNTANTITAAILRDGTWTLEPMAPGLKPMQASVGGYIERVGLSDESVNLFCNKDGIALGLRPSAVWSDLDAGVVMEALHGPLVAFGPMDADGDLTDATEATVQTLRRHVIPVLRTVTIQEPQ